MLGLERGKVRLVAHDETWAELFAQERLRLMNLLCRCHAVIEHVGSTAVPDIEAKPILDVLLGVPSRESFAHCREVLEQNDYFFRNAPTPEWWFFVRGPEEARTHHLHLCVYDGTFWRQHIWFRDYLRAHPEQRRADEQLKPELALRFASDRPVYTEGKSDFITSILQAGN